MWAARVRTWVEHGRGGMELRTAFVRATDRATRRFPDAWFELGQRTDDAVEGLADRTFTVCDRVPKGRFPYLGRTPFRAAVDDGQDDTAFQRQTFYARLSVLREVLRDDYARNMRHDPELRWRDELFREIGKVLPTVARCDGDRWRIGGLRQAHAPEAVRSILRKDPDAPLATQVETALTLLAQPMRQSALTHLLAEVRTPPQGEPAAAELSPSDPAAMAIRDAVLAAWIDLDANAQGLLAGLVRDEDYDTLIARYPGLGSRPQVSRAMKRISESFITRVAAAAGLEDPGEADTTPRTLLEHVLDVLLPLLPDPGDPHVRP